MFMLLGSIFLAFGGGRSLDKYDMTPGVAAVWRRRQTFYLSGSEPTGGVVSGRNLKLFSGSGACFTLATDDKSLLRP